MLGEHFSIISPVTRYNYPISSESIGSHVDPQVGVVGLIPFPNWLLIGYFVAHQIHVEDEESDYDKTC